MHRFALIPLFAAFAFAQSNDPAKPAPPADVDAALRARIQQFFDYHIDGQYRKAEGLVAEDTKDFFYARNKPKYVSCEISKIDYSEDFTKAEALVYCGQYIMIPGFANKPMRVPIRNTWRVEDGKWVWYVNKEVLLNTPFGKLAPPASANNATPSPALPPISTSTDFLYKQIKLDKNAVSLKPGESATVAISNDAPGIMTLSISKLLPGVESELDKSDLLGGGKATLTLRAAKGAKSGVLNLEVQQTLQLLPIQVTIVE